MDGSTSSLIRQYRFAMPICFVCNLPILSHQVGLVWQGGNAWDKLVREQVEESTLQQRLSFYKDFYSQVSDFSANNLLYNEKVAGQHNENRRRSSLAKLTDIIKEWKGGVSRAKSHEVNRRGTLADIAKTLPWKSNANISVDTCRDISRKSSKKRLKNIDTNTKNVSSNYKSLAQELKMKISKLWNKYGSESQKSLNFHIENVTEIPIKVSDNIRKSSKIIQAQHRPSTSSIVSDLASNSNVEKSASVTSIISPTTINNKRKDSITQIPSVCNSPSFERQKIRLRRQNTAFDEHLSSEDITQLDDTENNRKYSLSPDSAANYKHSKSIHLSSERKIVRQKLQRKNTSLRYQPSEIINRHSNVSPSTLPQSFMPNSGDISIRRQSTTTEEILIATGFRRQSTTEELIRCRNFRRQSSQSDDLVRYRKARRDSSAQITDGTIQTMFVETTSAFYESGTQTEPSTYDNNHYHEECLRCNSCGANLTGTHQKRARRIRNQIYCDLHFADVSLMECSDFMQQLRSFKPQSLGSAVARRKSSTTLIFPLPPQACSDEFCEDYPHNLVPTPGYWIECSRQKISGYDSTSLLDDNHSEDESDNFKLNEDLDSEKKIHSTESFDKLGDIYSTRKKHYISKIRDAKEKIKTTNEADTPKKKTLIEEQWEENGTFELTAVEQETYEKYFYGKEHWNYFTNDEDLGPVILSIKQENLHCRDQFRVLIRAISYTAHGLIPASCVFADRYNREEVVRSLGKEVNLNPELILGQLPDTSEELLKLDQVFIKSELKVGVIYIREGQCTEEEILDNNIESDLFSEFLNLIGEKVQLKGFDKYKGGLDTVHDLTGSESVYTNWRNIEIMFHVSTMLPYEKHDLQKLQRKRHIGNDIVCIVFLEADNTPFSPTCIKSHFLHTFIVVKTSPKNRSKITIYEISVVTRDEVGAYKPYLYEQNIFESGEMFREWILTKIVNGERASYSAPKFARMQERTRSQMLEDIVANLQNHVETGQIPQPYRRGSWRPIGHMRSSSPLLDSVRDLFEDSETLTKDFTKVFMNSEENLKINRKLFDVVFLVGQGKEKEAVFGVRAILGVRSRIFQEMLYGIQTGFGSPQVPVIEILSRPAPVLLSPKKIKSKNNFLQVPESDTARSKSIPNSPMVKRAFSRLGIISSWGKSMKKNSSQGQQLLTNDDRKKSNSSQESLYTKNGKEKFSLLDVPKLSMCADIQKIDKAKIAQREFSIIEFDSDTFRILLNYLHTGSCSITCITIPGLICAAEHYDLPDLLQACFHHAKQFLNINVVCIMLNLLESYYWRYTSASELVNMILAFVETRAYQIFQSAEFITLNESMLQLIINRNLEVAEIVKFEAVLKWAMHRVKSKTSSKIDPKTEFEVIMERLSRDIKLHLISPHDLIKVVLPSKAIRNEQILETLMYQANSGMYRINESYFKEYTQRLHKQDSRLSDGTLNANCSKS